MTGAALAAVALGSATQVALYLKHFGVSHRTDGFIAAFAVYSLIVVLAQILRTTAVPLLSGRQPRLDGIAFGWAIVLIALVATFVCEAAATPLANVLAGSTGPAGRHVAQESLRVMAPAAGLQLIAAGLAVMGGLRERLVPVALAYMLSALVGLAAFLPLRGPASQSVLAWTTLVASLVLVAALLVSLGVPSPHRRRSAAVLRAAFAVLRSVPVPASFVLMYPITLALATHAHPGQITLFGLAFTACSYLAGFTGQGLSMVDAVALSRIDSDAMAQRSLMVSRAFRYSLLAAALGFGVAVLIGGPVVRALVTTGSAGARESFSTQLLLLAPWVIATLGLWATLPALLANVTPSAERWLGLSVIGLVLAHICAALIARAIAGFDGLVVAMVAAPALFVAVALKLVVPSAGPVLIRNALVVATAAALSFGAAELLARAALGGGLLSGVLAALAGAALYAVLAAAAYPDAARTVAGLLGGRAKAVI
jgi:hypothetical protein